MLNNADEYTDTLTEEDSLMTLYTDYDFNESTGRYTLKNPIYNIIPNNSFLSPPPINLCFKKNGRKIYNIIN